MQTRSIVQTDLEVSCLAYGTGMLDTSYMDPQFKDKAVRAIRDAYEQGITFFDLADVYGHGLSEMALGEVLKASPGLRNKLVIQSKCNMVISPKWTPEDYTQPFGVDTRREYIVRAVEGSLKRLGVQHLDVLLLHRPDPALQLEEVAQAFDELHRGGKVRFFGLCNHEVPQMELLRQHLHQPLVAHQIRVGLGYHLPVVQMLEYCRAHQIQVQAYSPLRVGANFFEGGNLFRPWREAPDSFRKVTAALNDLAKRKDTNGSAIALAWLLHHPDRIVPIIGTSNPKYIRENCEADRVNLSKEEWQQLTDLAAAIQPS